MQSINQCPICKGKSFQPYLTCVDNTVSHETFKLVKCETCGFVITSPRPADNELGKYYLSEAYISHAAKSSTLFDKIYKVSRHFTLSWKLSLIRKYLPKGSALTLLDYGCGTGDFLKKCQTSGFSVVGVEPSPIAKNIAADLTKAPIHETINEINQTFDVITLWHVLEHVPNLNEKIAELKNKMSKNGTMFIAVPNHKSTDAKAYKSDWAGYDVPRHLWHFDQQTMKQLLANHALQLKEIVPMKLDAIYVSMLSEKYKAGKNSLGAMIQGFVTGLNSNFRAVNKEYSSLIYVIKK